MNKTTLKEVSIIFSGPDEYEAYLATPQLHALILRNANAIKLTTALEEIRDACDPSAIGVSNETWIYERAKEALGGC